MVCSHNVPIVWCRVLYEYAGFKVGFEHFDSRGALTSVRKTGNDRTEMKEIEREGSTIYTTIRLVPSRFKLRSLVRRCRIAKFGMVQTKRNTKWWLRWLGSELFKEDLLLTNIFFVLRLLPRR